MAVITTNTINCLYQSNSLCTTSHTPVAWCMVHGALNVGMMKTGKYNMFTFQEYKSFTAQKKIII